LQKSQAQAHGRRRIAACWRTGEKLGFAIEAGGVQVVEQFLRYEGGNAGIHAFRLFWRVKRRDGGVALEATAELKTDDFGLPVSFESHSARDVVQKLSFGERAVTVRRRDGSEFELRTAKRVGLVVQGNVLLHLAILLPTLRGLGSYSALNLSPGTLALSEIAMRRQGRRWSADQGFTLTCDAAGKLGSFKGGVSKGRRLNRPFPGISRTLRTGIARYRAPRTIRMREITVPGTVPLGAALSLPRLGRPPYPALLFLQGSGRHDRHGISSTLDTGIHAIVDGLAARGIAGLRFDSRGAGTSRFGDPFESGIEARLSDASAALRALAMRPEIDAKNLFVMGHSLGGIIAMQLAASARVKGALLLAPPGRRIDRIILEQIGRALERYGLSPVQVRQRTRRLARDLAKLQKSNEAPSSQWGLTKLAMADLMRLEPLDLAAKVRAPLLICQGARDIQVSLERDALPLFRHVAEGNRASQLVVLADGDHLFRHESGTSSPERYFVKRPLAHGLLSTLESWMRYQMKGE
jgi:alpha-beta hydrolase superfamily lysophospholipase